MLAYLNGASAEKNVFQILSPRASTKNLLKTFDAAAK
jgi:hypothetical protein